MLEGKECKSKKYGLKGYLTVEASFLIPMVLWLYLLFMFAAFFLYDRCLLTQDAYLLSFRGSVFTGWSEGYGEVIYGCLPGRDREALRGYLEQRMGWIDGEGNFSGKYPAFQKIEGKILMEKKKVSVRVMGRVKKEDFMGIKVNAEAFVPDPVSVIREARRE